MPRDAIDRTAPALRPALEGLPALHDLDALWAPLRRLLAAPAPSGGAALPGGVGDVIAALAGELGLPGRAWLALPGTGDLALALGADRPAPDVVIVAHMDRPSYRVAALDAGALYPICANRFPPGEYRAPAQAVRFADGRLVVGARGTLVSRRAGDDDALHFEVEQGTLDWADTVLLDAPPARSGEVVTSSGLDNSLGVLVALLAAAALAAVEDVLIAASRRCVVVFTDQEEGLPDAFFGHGAARLAHVLPLPTRGCIVVDGHNPGDPAPRIGHGVSVASASGWGRGSIVPPHYQALAHDLADGLNRIRPGTVQFGRSRLSRSDDMALSRWARVVCLCGPPLAHAHTAREKASLRDVQSAAWWLAYLVAAALPLAPDLLPRYALDR